MEEAGAEKGAPRRGTDLRRAEEDGVRSVLPKRGRRVPKIATFGTSE
jgi:hypothetical protein